MNLLNLKNAITILLIIICTIMMGMNLKNKYLGTISVLIAIIIMHGIEMKRLFRIVIHTDKNGD